MVAHSADAPSGLDLHEGDGAVLLQLGDGGPTKSCWGKMIDALPHLRPEEGFAHPCGEEASRRLWSGCCCTAVA